MDKKLKRKVLANGPVKSIEAEIECAAWLIENGLAKGKILPSSRPGESVYDLMWQGMTLKGERYLENKSIFRVFLEHPFIISVVAGLLVTYVAANYF